MDVGYIAPEKGRHWAQEAKEISAMLGGLIQARKKSEFRH